MSETLHIYIRVSTIAQEEDGTSLVTQEEMGKRRAKELGMAALVWNEGGQSSRHDDLENRPKLKELLGRIDSGNVKHLWVYAHDRLSRNETTWNLIRIKLRLQNVTLYTSTGIFTLSSPTDKLMLGVLAELSSFDNSVRAERTRLGKLNRIRQGYWMGGPPPYGYKIEGKKLVRNDEEAKWVNVIFERYLSGQTINEIRSLLLEKGVPTRRKNQIWSQGSINSLLSNTHYSGHYTVKSIPCQCEAIVPATVFQKATEAKKNRSKRRIRESNQQHFYLLRDLLTCGHCGSNFSGRRYEKQTRSVYYCPRKERNYANKGTGKEKRCDNSRYLKIEETDNLVWETVLGVLENSAHFKAEVLEQPESKKRAFEQKAQEMPKWRKRLQQVEREIREHGEAKSRVEADKLLQLKTPEQTKSIISAIQDQLTKLQAKKDELVAKIADHEDEAEWNHWVGENTDLWENLLNLDKDAHLKVVLDHLVKSIKVESLNKRTHRLTIFFKLPYFGGQFTFTDPKKPLKGYTVSGGEDQIEVTFSDAKKNS